MAGPIAHLYAKVAADLTGFEKDLTSGMTKAAVPAGDAAGKTLGERMKAQFSKQNLGKGLVQGLGLGAGLIGAQLLAKGIGAVTDAISGSIDAAKQFDDQLRTINTVAQVSDDQLNRIGDSIQALSRETGKSTDDLAQGFYDLVSAGVPADKAMAALKASAILATGALGTTGEAVDLVTSALGAYGKDASEATRVTDIFAQAVADGKTTVADLAGGFSVIGPIAAAAGIELEEVAAGTAKMTLSGDTASQAMTKMKSAISALLTPNIALNAVQKETGVNFAELAKDKGLAVALEAIRVAVNGDQQAFAKILGSTEALSFGLSVTGDNAGAMATELERVETAANEGGVALGQYNEKSKSAIEVEKRRAANTQVLMQKFGKLVMPIYDALAGAADLVVSTIIELGEAFHDFERFLSPHLAKISDTDEQIRTLAESYGLVGSEVVEFTRKKREEAKALADAAVDLTANTKALQDALAWMTNENHEKDTAVSNLQGQLIALGAEAGVPLQEVFLATSATIRDFGGTVTDTEAFVNSLRGQFGLFGPAVASTVAPLDEAREAIRQYQLSLDPKPLNAFWGSMVAAAETGAAGLSPGNILGPAAAVKQTARTMMRTMTEMKEPWKAVFQDLVAWAKDPFKPEKFEDWIAGRAQALMKKARQAEVDGHEALAERYRAAARVIKSPLIAAAIEAGEAIDGLMDALLAFDRLNQRVGPGVTRMGTNEKVAGRASGGPVWANTPYIVGEHRAEVFVPNQNGTILPSVGGSSDVHFYVHDVDGGLARAGITEDGVARIVGNILTNAAATAGTGYIR